MKTNNLFKTVLWAFFAIIMVGLTSCNNDDDMPAPPVDEPKDKGHEEWSKVTFTFHSGHLHSSTFHGNPVNEEVKYYKSEQDYSIELDEKGNLITSNTPIRMIKGDYYALEIKYYNKNNELINTEFANEKNAPIHQHFFLTKNAKKLDSNEDFQNPNNIIEYTYRDTNPIDESFREDGVSLIGETNPLGFKGYFMVKEKDTQFVLNIILVHIIKGDKFDDNGKPYPYNAPNRAFLSVQDLNINIPVRVYTSRYEAYEEIIQDIANEFGITYEEAEKDVLLQWDTPLESGNFWM